MLRRPSRPSYLSLFLGSLASPGFLLAAFALAVLLAVLMSLPAGAAEHGGEAAARHDDAFEHLPWRAIGPVNMSGRVSDVEGVPGDANVVYVGSASGGVWKTTNGGLTFEPIFDDQPLASIGDVALAPSNRDVIYVGTGEANPRNSVSFGNGVYKSTDAGATWRHLGLEKTRHIPRILVHPDDPDTLWVGALGSIYAPSEERGVYKSTDGGATFRRVLFVDAEHGVSSLSMDPGNPNLLYAGLWHFRRTPWTHTSGSREGGVWRSTDGGESWEKVGEGLPELMGRIAVEVAPTRPETVFVLAESNEGVLFRSDDRGKTFRKVNHNKDLISRGLYYTQLRVDPTDANRLYAVASRLYRSIDGGRSFQRISRSTHVDYHALWIDPKDPGRLWQGQDGGVAVSYDRGDTWEPIRNLPLGQYYQIFYDEQAPFYYTGGGLQDNGTWRGPSRNREPAGLLEDEWRIVSFGDAYFTVVHPDNPNLLLSESQAGGIVRTDVTNRTQLDVSPQPRRNDGGAVEDLTYRFNWNTPIVASPHDPHTVYFTGNVVFRTRDFGDTWEVISPDLTTDDPKKQGPAGGPVWNENTTAEYHTTIISFAESPAEAGVLWAGSDDGLLHVSRNDGESWENVTPNVPGVPKNSPVSHVEPSRTAAGKAYVSFDRHMFDDYRSHVFVTDDFGASWRRIGAGLPEEGWLWVVREDSRNPRVLYAGTEVGLYASWDAGASWERLAADTVPAVAVHDILVHPRENDLLLGTHGRGIWILDDAVAVQRYAEVQAEAGAAPACHLFPLRHAWRFPVRFTRYGLGDKEFKGENPPYGALITYFLRDGAPERAGKSASMDGPPDAADDAEMEGGAEEEGKKAKGPEVTLEILDASGAVVRTLREEATPRHAGINRTSWDLAYDSPAVRDPSARPEGNEFFGGPLGPQALPGTYTVRLTVDGEVHEQPVEVRLDPTVEVSPEALEESFRSSLELRDLASRAVLSLRALDIVGEQIDERRTLLDRLDRKAPEALAKAFEAREKDIEELASLLARPEDVARWAEGPRLVDHLTGLGAELGSYYHAPTAAQRDYLAGLRTETEQVLGRVGAFLGGSMAELNDLLTAEQLPPVAVPDPSQLAADGEDG